VKLTINSPVSSHCWPDRPADGQSITGQHGLEIL
jgi:hypothetical protein